MTKQKILEKAIKQAEAGGWELSRLFWGASAYAQYLLKNDEYKLLLTDHAFARALWGEKKVCDTCKDEVTKCNQKLPFTSSCPPSSHFCANCNIHVEWLYIWQYHLQQMVVSEDWLKYVEGTL